MRGGRRAKGLRERRGGFIGFYGKPIYLYWIRVQYIDCMYTCRTVLIPTPHRSHSSCPCWLIRLSYELLQTHHLVHLIIQSLTCFGWPSLCHRASRPSVYEYLDGHNESLGLIKQISACGATSDPSDGPTDPYPTLVSQTQHHPQQLSISSGSSTDPQSQDHSRLPSTIRLQINPHWPKRAPRPALLLGSSDLDPTRSLHSTCGYSFFFNLYPLLSFISLYIYTVHSLGRQWAFVLCAYLLTSAVRRSVDVSKHLYQHHALSCGVRTRSPPHPCPPRPLVY